MNGADHCYTMISLNIIWFAITTRIRSVLITVSAIKESRPLVGSSQNRIDGQLMSSVAKVTRRISPPEIPLILVPPNRTLRHLVRLKCFVSYTSN